MHQADAVRRELFLHSFKLLIDRLQVTAALIIHAR